MKRWLALAALLVAAACSAPRSAQPEPEPTPHLAPPSRPYLESAPLALVNAFEWEVERRDWPRAVEQLEKLLDHGLVALVRYPLESRRWIPAWRYLVERSAELPSEFLAAYRNLLDDKFQKALRRNDGRMATLRRYFLCTGADLLADALANEALEDGDRWQAADLWHLVERYYTGSTLAWDVMALRRQWALGLEVRTVPGIQVGDALQPHAQPIVQATSPDNAPPTPMERPTEEDEPGWEHTHVITEELFFRFTRDGPGEPLYLNVVTGAESMRLCRWYKERAPGSSDPDKFLTTCRPCNPTVLLSADRAWMISGFGFVASINLRHPGIEWVLEYPRDGVWRERGSGRLEQEILALLMPDSNSPCAIDVIEARMLPLDSTPGDLQRIDRIGPSSILFRQSTGRSQRVSFSRR